MRKYFPCIGVIVLFLAIVVPVIIVQFLCSDVKINLSAPKNYQIGELVVLDATESISKRLQWTILPKTQNFKIVGKTAYFSSSVPVRYTVIITATYNGTLATKVIFLNPGAHESGPNKIEPLIVDPLIKKIDSLINSNIITTLDDAILVTNQLNFNIPEFKTFKEFEKWIADNS